MNVKSYIQKSLMDLGLSEGESQVYFAILEGKEIEAADLIKKTKYSTAGVYKILASLIDKEFIMPLKKNRATLYMAVPLNQIAGKFAVRSRKMGRISDKFKELATLNNVDGEAEVMEESKLLDYYLNLPYKIDDQIFCIGSFEAVINFFGPNIEKTFIKSRVKKGKHATALIFDDSKYTHDLTSRDIFEKRETKVVPNSGYPNEFSYIFGDRFMTFYKDMDGKVKVLALKSPHIARAQMVQFQMLWRNVEK